MISYELPLALAVASPLLLANTLSFRDMVNYQSGYWLGFIPRWNVWPEILGFVVFMIAGFAETNRVPFDLPEAENELVAGFHVEYSSMKFAAFFMAEYANMVTVTSVATLLFLGGWQPPFPEPYSDFVPILIFVSGRFDGALSRLASGAPDGQVHAAGDRLCCFWGLLLYSASPSWSRC